MNNTFSPIRPARWINIAMLAALLPCSSFTRAAALLDVWRADSLALNDGDTVTTWNSASNRAANSAVSAPLLKHNATPAGGKAVRFNNTQRMAAGSSPVGGRAAFSIALVFKPDAPGGNFSGASWYGKSGLVDAEQGGVTADWGTVLTETGNVGLGIGSGDTSSYSTGASLVDGAFHVAVFAWGGGSQTIFVDSRAPVSVGSPTAARNSAGFSIGGINTDANGTGQRFVGDLVEIRFYDSALTSIEASNVIDELRFTHILGTQPRIFSFTAGANQIYAGQSVTLSWAVSNAVSVAIDQGIGAVSPSNSLVLSPLATTTYTLTATNTNGVRTAQFTVAVDPGVPSAFNFPTNTAYNTPVGITLRGFDPQGSNLAYSIVQPPAHGTLIGTPPNITYTPATNFGGLDSFTFKVNDGAFDSAPATVSLNVIPPALPPTGITLSTTNIPSAAGPGAFIAALQAIDINNLYGDTHTFALVGAFGDNAKFTVSGNTLSAGPSFAGGPGAGFAIRLKTTDSASFSHTQDVALIVFDAPRSVVINEFHYNPAFNPVRESFIEIYNDTDATVDISNWRVRGGVDFFFPPNTFLASRAFAVVAEDPATMQTRYGVSAFGPWVGGLNNEGEELTLRDALNSTVDRVDYKNEFPWPVAPDGNGPSAQLTTPSLDNDLGSSWRGATPTPGATNLAFATNAEPNIRQVDHSPNSPRSTNQVVITARVTDPEGVASVVLAYQVVTPGNFIPATLPLTGAQLNSLNATPTLTNSLNPAFEASSNWVSAAMHDDGLNGDAVAGDGTFSVLLPQQANRVLVRYRITCTDILGASRRAPFEDDPSLNFAYFVYDGIPSYLGFPAASLQTLPVYTLITRDVDMNQCAAWYSPFNNGTDQLPQTIGAARNQGRLQFNWEAAFVHEGKVFDHVKYRTRGANGRYFNGKRSFRIKFNDGALFQARDNEGRKFPAKWREVVTGKGQSNRGGEQFALNEVVSYFLWNKVGVPAPNTLHFHFRVIRGASEAGADQYSGDFWGLNWAQEKYDASFLDSHNLPKGNLYKLVDNFVDAADEMRYQGAYAPTNGADFINIENNLDGFKNTDWLNAHANYTNWYRYFAIARGIRHYDTWPSANKNGAWYFEPRYGASNSFLGRMMQLPYDSTDTWGATWNNGNDMLYNGIFATADTGGDAGFNPAMQLEYRNVVREIRSLLFQPDQMNAIIDGFAGIARPVAAADVVRWSNAPAPANYVSLAFGNGPGVTNGLPGYAQDMKNFMFTGGSYAWWIDRQTIAAGGWVTTLDTEATDAAIPNRPTITYAGSNGFPADGLAFQSSAFNDPQGAGTFGAMQWRVAEVLATNTVVTNTAQLRLEWDAAWTSPELPVFTGSNTFPEFAVEAGRRYRARVRHKDDTGRWSAWSLPVEFAPAPRDTAALLRSNLVFNEIMYHPPGEGATDGDEFEFIELKNIGSFTLNLSGLYFSGGVTFTFTNGTWLAPGAVFLLARNPAVLGTRHPGAVVNGDYSDKLNNDGETVAIRHPSQGEIISITYGNRAPWPAAADGFGFSLVRDPATGGYRASAAQLGTPGADGGAGGVGGVVINEFLGNSTLPARDAVELLNNTATNIDISGWFLTDDAAFPQKFRIPARPPLAPGEFAVFTEDDFNSTPGLGVSFSLGAAGEQVYLFSANLSQLTGYSHGVAFGAAADGETFGRQVISTGEEQFPAQTAPTFGAPNSGPRIGPVVLSEIMFNPSAANFEFIELRNVTSNAVPLYDPAFPTNTWRLNGLGFTFPTNITIPPFGALLLAQTNLAAFTNRHFVPADAQILARYAGGLQDSGERLELQMPAPPTTNGVAYVTVDEVRYNDKAPWPWAADGYGPSLQKLAATLYGNDPVNWTAAIPSPGAEPIGGTEPVTTTQPQSQTVAAGNNVSFTIAASGSLPLNYAWSYNGANIPDATNATLTLTGVQLSQTGLYSAFIYNGAGAVLSGNATLTVLAPAAFTLQPTNQNVLPGTNVTLAALAVGNGTVRYQWRFNGTNLPNATNATHSFTGASLNHHGAYSVIATDDISTTASANAFLYVLVRPVVVVFPAPTTVVQGQSVTLTCVATGAAPIHYRWLRNNTTYVAQTTSTNITIASMQTNTLFRLAITNLAGSTSTTNITVTVLRDSDGDGVPDNWEIAHGMITNSAADGLLDSDNDGMINRDEYFAGTRPNDSNSVLRVSMLFTNGVPLQFTAQSNIIYTIQYRTNLDGSVWQTLSNVPPAPGVRPILFDSPPGATNGPRYFRILVPAQP